MTRRQVGAGVGLGILVGIGLIASMGQVVPPNGSAGGGGGGVSITPSSAPVGQAATSQGSNGTVGYGPLSWSQATDADWYDDFLTCGVASALWAAAGTAGTGSVSVNGASVAAATHPGICDVETGTTAASRASVTGGVSSVVFSGGTWTSEWYAMLTAASTSLEEYETEIGFLDTTSTEPIDGAFFLYDPQNVSTLNPAGGTTNAYSGWLCCTASNSVRQCYSMDGTQVSGASFTTVAAPFNAGALPGTNWVKLSAVVNAAGTEADFYVNGAPSCKITADIPTTAARATAFGYRHVSAVGTVSKPLYLDWFHGHMTLTTPRL